MMNKRERKKIYKEAIKKWGYPLQLNMLMEECAELIQATSKVLRKGNKLNSVWKKSCGRNGWCWNYDWTD